MAARLRSGSRDNAFLRLPQKSLERIESLRTDMMLDALGVDASRFRTDAERAKETLDDQVPTPALFGQHLPGFGQKHAAVRPLRNEAILGKAF